MNTFTLYEYGKKAYASENLIFVVHELLSIVVARYSYQQHDVNDLFIEETIKDFTRKDSIRKRFKYIKNNYKYDPSNNNIIDKTGNIKYICDEVCHELLQQIVNTRFKDNDKYKLC